jgi:D-alanine-D-alanine ligase
VDLRVTPQDEIYLLEVNTIPGMTQTSDLPKAAAAAGMDFYQLIKHMLMSAVEKINN